MKILFIGGPGNISMASSLRTLEKGMELYLLTRGTSLITPKGAHVLKSDINDVETEFEQDQMKRYESKTGISIEEQIEDSEWNF